MQNKNQNSKTHTTSQIKNIITIALIIIVVIILIGILGYYTYQKNNQSSSDAKRFIEEYTALNDTIRESDGALYNNVNLPKNIPVKYITATEAVDIINNKTGIIYFGAPWCPWCRNAIEVLFDAAKQNKVKEIYYVDMDQVRNVWEIIDNELVKTTEEGEGYYELLEALTSVIGEETYKLTKDETTYDTHEQRIYMPLVISVQNGHILKSQKSTVQLNEGQTKYDELTKDQYQELYQIYDDMIKSTYETTTCSKDGC